MMKESSIPVADEKSWLLAEFNNSEPTRQRRIDKIYNFLKGAPIPQRWVFALMGFIAVVNAFTMRICLSLAITEMVVETDSSEITDETCPSTNSTSTTNSAVGTYEWDESLQGIILSSFYWGYVITHLPGGQLAERFGGKYTLGLGILSTAIFTLITPLVVEEFDATGLIVLRFLMGLGEGTTFPALNSLISKWAPPAERSKIGSLILAGAQIGTVVANALSGVLLQYSSIGWRSVFYVFGSIGVAWFVVFVLVCYSTPDDHPFVSDREKKYLHDNMHEHTHNKFPPTPWRHLLKSVPLWALVAASVGHDWGFFTMVTDLPKYMSGVLKFSIKTNGLLTALPYLCMWCVSIGSSWIADWMINEKIMTRTNVRKMFTTIASVGPACFLIAASYAGCDRYVVVTLFTVGMALMGTFYPGMRVNSLDLSPNYSGTVMAIVNGIGALSGIITPYIVGVLTPNQTVNEWRLVFWIIFGVFIVTNTAFLFFASGEVQYWNDPEFLLRDTEGRKNKKEGDVAAAAATVERGKNDVKT
ncbi:putative inorganic phosphate cotransporter isoform X1 [Neodiprion virginianus]|uniref:putative inorganic phosphate cotransporter isoform X1 n=1 Tax=Neodiprion virginianus TaxID=2961670 RepID=UPI001EE74020|nr:putative inorganic phosphate cotransporter isoform X1 [Neodiprion virginianus]